MMQVAGKSWEHIAALCMSASSYLRFYMRDLCHVR